MDIEKNVSKKHILDTAIDLVNGARAATHGDADEQMQLCAELLSAYLNVPIQPHQVCGINILQKLSRSQYGIANADDWVDIVGYAAIGGELQLTIPFE